MASEQNKTDVGPAVGRREEQNRIQLRLTDEQLVEVRRRRAEKDAKAMTLAEFNEQLCRRYGV